MTDLCTSYRFELVASSAAKIIPLLSCQSLVVVLLQVIPSFLASCSRLCVATDPLLYFDIPRLDLNEVHHFPIAGDFDRNGFYSELLPLVHIKYFEWQRCCA